MVLWHFPSIDSLKFSQIINSNLIYRLDSIFVTCNELRTKLLKYWENRIYFFFSIMFISINIFDSKSVKHVLRSLYRIHWMLFHLLNLKFWIMNYFLSTRLKSESLKSVQLTPAVTPKYEKLPIYSMSFFWSDTSSVQNRFSERNYQSLFRNLKSFFTQPHCWTLDDPI